MKFSNFCRVAAASALLIPGSNAPAGGHEHSDGEGVVSLDVFSDETRIHLLTGETRKENEPPELLFRSSEDGKIWSDPVRVDAGLPSPHNVHRGMDPQIAASGNSVIAIWMTKGSGYADSGPLVTALSQDGGKTWRAGPNPADDGATTGHGFIDVASDRSGRFHLTWLDSRDGAQGLRFSSSVDGGGGWTRNVTVKSGTCECCWNTIAVGSGNDLAILFRDKGPRDMGLAWSTDAGASWLKPRPVGNFGWQFEGCPHVGGGVAMDASAGIHAVVWNGADENRGVFYLSSKDKGSTWSSPHRLGTEDASHPDLAVSKSGAIAAVWDVYMGDGKNIVAAVSKDTGATWSAPVSLTGDEKISAANPRVIATADGFLVFWTETKSGSPARWRSASLER